MPNVLLMKDGALMLSPFSGRVLTVDTDDTLPPNVCGPCCAPCPYGNNTIFYIKDYVDDMFGACEDCVIAGDESWYSNMRTGAAAGGQPCYALRRYGIAPAGWTGAPTFDGGHKMQEASVALQQFNTTTMAWEPIHDFDDPTWVRKAPDGDCRWLFELYCHNGSDWLRVYQAVKIVGRAAVGEYTDTGAGCGTGPGTIQICIDSVDGAALPECLECPT